MSDRRATFRSRALVRGPLMCDAPRMSEQPATPLRRPQWDVADRMRKALRVSGVGVQEIADYLGVTRSTVSTWINGRIEPSVQTLRLWAQQTGVSYEWLTQDDDGPRPGIPTVAGEFKSRRR
jgi:ribosome-binding protein aMBF1 (putative translation factor)